MRIRKSIFPHFHIHLRVEVYPLQYCTITLKNESIGVGFISGMLTSISTHANKIPYICLIANALKNACANKCVFALYHIPLLLAYLKKLL